MEALKSGFDYGCGDGGQIVYCVHVVMLFKTDTLQRESVRTEWFPYKETGTSIIALDDDELFRKHKKKLVESVSIEAATEDDLGCLYEIFVYLRLSTATAATFLL